MKTESKFQFYFLVDYRDNDWSVKVKVPQTWQQGMELNAGKYSEEK